MLAGVRVVTVCNYLSGPFASRILADLGADVIKVERPDGGDTYRTHKHTYDDDTEDLTYRFLQYNRGKRSVALNLKAEKGRSVFKSLTADADVVIENLRPGKMAGLGLGYDDIADINEDVIYCSISGYGESGPYRDRPALDTLVQAMSGLVDQNRADATHPALTGIYIADITSSLFGVISILSALHDRTNGGGGSYIDLAMLDSLVALFNHEAAEYSATGTAPPRLRGSVVPQGVYETADTAIALSVLERNWPTFCEVVGKESWIDDDRFSTSLRRQQNESELDRCVGDVLESESTDHWMERLLEAGILAAPVNTVDEVFTNEQIQDREIVREASHPTMGSYVELDYPAQFDAYDTPTAAVPHLGEHTDEVLKEIGIPDDLRAELYREGVAHRAE